MQNVQTKGSWTHKRGKMLTLHTMMWSTKTIQPRNKTVTLFMCTNKTNMELLTKNI